MNDDERDYQRHVDYDARLTALRRRLFALIDWFRQDASRLTAAQRARFVDADWHVRVQRACAALRDGADDASLTRPIAASLVSEVLFDLEVVDRAVAMLSGRTGPAPPMRFGAGDDAVLLVRNARPRTPGSAHQAGSLASHLRYHTLVPARIRANHTTYPVRLIQADPGLCLDAVERGALTIAVTGFGDGAALAPLDGTPFTAVATSAQRGDDLFAAITAAAAARVHVFVAPELTLPPAARDRLLDRLRWSQGPDLLVPGSFHEQVDGRTVHRALLVDGAGNLQLEHRKLALFGSLDPDDREPVEAVEAGGEITAMITPVGLVALAICRDFCDDQVHEVWQQLQPELLLVPAYGRGASAHRAAARRIARAAGTITVLAHEAMGSVRVTTDEHGAEVGAIHSFVHGPDLGGPGVAHQFAPRYAIHSVPFQNAIVSLAWEDSVD